jgi:hypothetical protein
VVRESSGAVDRATLDRGEDQSSDTAVMLALIQVSAVPDLDFLGRVWLDGARRDRHLARSPDDKEIVTN